MNLFHFFLARLNDKWRIFAAMIITILGSGTSQGVPVIGCQCPVCQSNDPRNKRLRTSIMIQSDEVTVVVDAGPDFRQQMLRERVDHLDAVLVTHEHKDHIGGLDDLRPFIFRQGNKPMPLYVADSALPEIKREYSYAFAEELYPGAPTYEIHHLDETPFDLGDLHIQPIKMKHFTLTSYAFRIGKFAYVTDLSEITDEIVDALQSVDFLVLEAIVQTAAIDKNGKQLGSPANHILKRVGDGRWYISTYEVRF